MATQVVSVPVGSPQIFNINQPGGFGCILGQAGATGTVLLEYSADGVNWIQDGRGASGTGLAVCLGQGTFGNAFFTKARVTAATVAAVAVAMDLNPRMLVICNSSVAMATPNATAEGAIFAMRFPAGFLKPYFILDIDAMFSCTNSANVKTIKGYFGNVGAGTAGVSQAITSFAGARLGLRLAGRGDNATVICSSPGAAGGFGGNTTAPVSISSNCAYQTQEQEFYITSTKATGSETLTLDAITVSLWQGQLP